MEGSFIVTLAIIVVTLYLVTPSKAHGTHGAHGSQEPGGTGGIPDNPVNFHDPKVTQDEAHIKEHLKDQINVDKQMSPQELEFHYFRLHDTNNDTKLDGLEILAALNHMAPMFELKAFEKEGKTEEQIAALQRERHAGAMKYFTDIIDKVLRDDDFNRDGYVSYPEYMNARQRDYHRYNQEMARQQQNMQQQMAQAQQQQQYQQYVQFQQWQQQQQQNKQGTHPPGVPPPLPPSNAGNAPTLKQ